MNHTTHTELTGALGLLSEAGIAVSVVDRCPVDSCAACREAAAKDLPAAA